MTISLTEIFLAGVGTMIMLTYCIIAADYETNHQVPFRQKMFLDYGVPAILWIVFLLVTDQLMKHGWLQ